MNEHAWYDANAGGKTRPVGQKPPNAWGLCDVHGNVSEWCADWYDDKYYARSPVDHPPGPTQASCRVIRGGSWCHVAGYCRAAARDWYEPSHRTSFLGFRVALVPPGR